MRKPPLDILLHSYFPLGFQLSRKAWERFDVRGVFGPSGTTQPVTETYAVRRLADRVNRMRLPSVQAGGPIQPGQLISVGVIVDVLRYVAVMYCHEEVPGVLARGLEWTGERHGHTTAQQPPPSFVRLFPPLPVIQGHQADGEFLQGSWELASNQETVTREIALLSLATANQAFRPFRELFDDTDFKQQSPYLPFVEGLEGFFDQQPIFRPLGKTLFECLRAPMRAAPDSLEGQLRYIREHWASFLPPELLERLLMAADILKEEWQMRGFGPGPNLVLEFVRGEYGADLYAEPACFSRDADWMSNVVLIAKSVYVWLDQLSKKYQRHIRCLSDVPDEELDRLARWGFSGLWLIGLWERSPASQKIKQMTGNPEALASAYSVYDYMIAEDLGGEPAFQNLRDRAWRRGIRLSSDMVPNHMGIYSKWVIEHPQWFLQLDYPPFPSYRFTGPDLSGDDRVGLFIEDGYWDRRDAAVVFKRLDKWTGEARYMYHGNDGTNMPWNDTAQLNFTLPEVREAVIQMILHVARKFPIIRFDAAMTLAKRHYQRLWFPQHGEGGAVPSRAEHGVGRAQFDALVPKEFWREVVDRVTQEVPETLLLAEAFWLMEGYFVRTLGMHRVYNSAFMNMLKMEDNCKYRMTVKNVLEFSPEVLKRFVNFMNNPDELTAVQQFGKGDKYIGVAVMMVTMPGLPMFGHGQIEGFAEKYGMEYRRAYWDEQIDEEFIRRHEAQVFPLMRRRRLFSGAANFALYDFLVPEGWVDENVFAYSNRADGERAVILYNNAYNTTRGRIHTSTAINTGNGEEQVLVRRTLAEALALNTGSGIFYAFRDHPTGLEYLRSGRQLADEGMFAELSAYQYHAFLDFREIHDHDGSWARLTGRLNGRGVPGVDEAYREMQLDPILVPFHEALNADLLRALAASEEGARARFSAAISGFLRAVGSFVGSETTPDNVLQDILGDLDAVQATLYPSASLIGQLLGGVFPDSDAETFRSSYEHIFVAWAVLRHLGRFQPPGSAFPEREAASARLEDWLLRKAVARVFSKLTGNEPAVHFDALLVSMLVGHENLLSPESGAALGQSLRQLFHDPLAQQFLHVNHFQGVFWLNKEQLERLVEALLLASAVRLHAEHRLSSETLAPAAQAAARIIHAAQYAAYQVEKMMLLLAG